MGPGNDRSAPAGSPAALPLDALEHGPAPISLVREDGRILLRNARAEEFLAHLFGHTIPVGGTLADRLECPLVQERLAIMRQLAVRQRGAVVRELVNGEQVLTFITYIPPGPGEELARFLLMFQRAPGPRRAQDFPGEQFIECKTNSLGPLGSLTEREMEILSLIQEGLTACQIGTRISRSEETVNSHKASLLKKLGCHSAAQLAVIAHRAGLRYSDGRLLAHPRARE